MLSLHTACFYFCEESIHSLFFPFCVKVSYWQPYILLKLVLIENNAQTSHCLCIHWGVSWSVSPHSVLHCAAHICHVWPIILMVSGLSNKSCTLTDAHSSFIKHAESRASPWECMSKNSSPVLCTTNGSFNQSIFLLYYRTPKSVRPQQKLKRL